LVITEVEFGLLVEAEVVAGGGIETGALAE
jgi:hypothetical protein